jgi:chloramphenicol-sensitive protein RarD
MTSKSAKGVTFSLASSVFFGVLYYVMPYMAPLSGEAVWALRVLFGLPTITLILLITKELPMVGETVHRIRKKPAMLLGMLATSLLLAAQIWVYMWAPLNGKALQVALGYFLFPLVMIVVGRLLYKDRLTRLQLIATLIAAVGVGSELIRVGQISWEALLVSLGYPLYFVIRKALGLNNTTGMWFDMLFVVPLATFTIFASVAFGPSLAGATHLSWFVPLVGVSSAVAILLFVLAGKYLSMSVFGLLSYIEPALLMLAALLIGESIAPGEFPLYVAIWVAILLVVIDGVRQIRRAKISNRPPIETPRAAPAHG